MSHIFDALQRSEFEQSGSDAPVAAVATELLQAAERKTGVERGSTVEREVLPEHEAVVEMPAFAELSSVAEQPTQPAVDQFSQFQPLRVLVPPQSKLVSLTDKESLAAEKFRFLSVRLRQLKQSRPLKKVLITSSIPQEGKSMVAANLACTLARRAQQKTLLLEGDLRRPALSQMFGLGKLSGITEWLQGERGAASSIYRLEDPGLWILPAGSSPSNPLELMQSGRLSALMDQLSAWFDWIVIDSPPVLPLGDTSVWMRLADGILLVTRQGATEKKQLQRGLEAIEQSKLIGALLNGAIDAAHSDYYQRYASPAVSIPDVPAEQ
jgi:capsular exopolysaccharide synthesis family protein